MVASPAASMLPIPPRRQDVTPTIRPTKRVDGPPRARSRRGRISPTLRMKNSSQKRASSIPTRTRTEPVLRPAPAPRRRAPRPVGRGWRRSPSAPPAPNGGRLGRLAGQAELFEQRSQGLTHSRTIIEHRRRDRRPGGGAEKPNPRFGRCPCRYRAAEIRRGPAAGLRRRQPLRRPPRGRTCGSSK